MPNNKHEQDWRDEPATNGRFVTYTGVFALLITVCGGLLGLAWHLIEQAQQEQDRRIEKVQSAESKDGERIAAVEAEMKDLQRSCRPRGN